MTAPGCGDATEPSLPIRDDCRGNDWFLKLEGHGHSRASLVRAPLFGRHKRVLIDTSIWIYHFEQHRKFGEPAGRFIGDLEDGKFGGIASELTLLELTVRPLRLGRQDVADDYEILLGYFPNLDFEPISRAILLDAAGLRARYRLRTPDAILLATGLRTGATLAVTNDEAWRAVPIIETAVLSDWVE